jgi:hypothetical protein
MEGMRGDPWPFNPEDEVEWRDPEEPETKYWIQKLGEVSPPFVVTITINCSVRESLTGKPYQLVQLQDGDGKRVIIEEPNPWEKLTGVPQPHGPRTTVWFGSRLFQKVKSYSEAWKEE